MCTLHKTYDFQGRVLLLPCDGQVVIAGNEMHCHDLEVMSLNPDRVELKVHGTSVLSRT